MSVRALAVLPLLLAGAVPARAQDRPHAPDRPVVGALGAGALVGWNEFFSSPSRYRAGWRATGGAVAFAPREATRGVRSIHTTPGHGGVLVLGQVGEFPGDRYGGYYSPIRFWTADVDPSGAVGPLRVLDEDDGGDVGDPVGWAGPDGEVLLAWHRGPRGRWVRRAPGGAWGTVRSLGRLIPSAIARDAAGRLVVAGRDRGDLTVRVGSRTLALGNDLAVSSGPALALSRDGMLLSWLSGERSWFARLDHRGRLTRRARLRSGLGQPVAVGIDRRGRGIAVTASNERATVRWLDRRGLVVRRQAFGHRGSRWWPQVAVAPSGAVLLAAESDSPRALTILAGSTRRALVPLASTPLAGPDASAQIAAGRDGEWWVAWRDERAFEHGDVWLQRFADGRADPAERMYTSGEAG